MRSRCCGDTKRRGAPASGCRPHGLWPDLAVRALPGPSARGAGRLQLIGCRRDGVRCPRPDQATLPVTEANGLHLAFRGLTAGLAAGWVWVAVALTGLVLAGSDPLAATTSLGNGTAGSGLISALAIAQVASGGIGLVFSYFFGRYFTVRLTLALTALAFAVLCWLATAYVLDGSWLSLTRQAVLTL